jgi:CRISPR/Cas system-associated exonuclease Cas4 (RecB family)
LRPHPEKVKKLATHHLVQVIAYAVAVEETFKKPVWRALIVSSEGSAAFEIRVGPVLRERVYRLVKELWRVVEEERLPSQHLVCGSAQRVSIKSFALGYEHPPGIC